MILVILIFKPYSQLGPLVSDVNTLKKCDLMLPTKVFQKDPLSNFVSCDPYFYWQLFIYDLSEERCWLYIESQYSNGIQVLQAHVMTCAFLEIPRRTFYKWLPLLSSLSSLYHYVNIQAWAWLYKKRINFVYINNT